MTSAEPPESAVQLPLPRWTRRLALAAVLLPVPLWLGLAIATDPGPRWVARYYPSERFAGEPTRVRERSASHYYNRKNPNAPNGRRSPGFSARWDTCLRVERPLDVPFMLVARGRARLLVDGEERLATVGEKRRRSRGAVLHFEPGVHHLEVELDPISWAAIALLASFDGDVPRPVEGEQLRVPAEGPAPCAAARP